VVEGAPRSLPRCARKGNPLHAFVDPLIPRVEGMPTAWKQILLNLLANA